MGPIGSRILSLVVVVALYATLPPTVKTATTKCDGKCERQCSKGWEPAATGKCGYFQKCCKKVKPLVENKPKLQVQVSQRWETTCSKVGGYCKGVIEDCNPTDSYIQGAQCFEYGTSCCVKAPPEIEDGRLGYYNLVNGKHEYTLWDPHVLRITNRLAAQMREDVKKPITPIILPNRRRNNKKQSQEKPRLRGSNRNLPRLRSTRNLPQRMQSRRRLW